MITGFATKRYHATQAALGGQWYQKGEAALKANQPPKAVDAFHTALVYARDNRVYQLRLAEALTSDHRLAEAESYLGSLWVQEPGNGTVNLELARLAANKPEVADAVRYYQNAIFGLWDSDPILHRRETRIELCEFLLAQGEKTQAESELIALQTDLPEDAALHAHIAAMFMQVNDYRHALEEFQHALKLNPRQASAWTGAGEASFQMSRYADARHYLERAVAAAPEDSNAAGKLAVSKLVLALDPFARRLSQRQRSQRTVAAFHQALSRLQQCAQSRGIDLQTQPSASPLQDAYAQARKMQPQVNDKNLRLDPDLIANVMDQVALIEDRAEQACGTPEAPDQALILISQMRGVAER